MHPWQVAFGLSLATVVPLAYFVWSDLGYLDGLWRIAWSHYSFHLVAAPSATVLLMGTVYYQLARSLFLGDVGSRIEVLDRSVREGRGGDAELSAALQREESGDYTS